MGLLLGFGVMETLGPDTKIQTHFVVRDQIFWVQTPSYFLAIFHVLEWTFLNFPPFSVFLAIFQVLKSVFLIFRDFQFSRHIPGPSVCISHFSRFLVISSFFKSSSGCFSFSMIFSFLAIFHVLEWTF